LPDQRLPCEVQLLRKRLMKDQYVGDFGDFVKLALLRAISQGHRLAVLWWRTPDEVHKRDGRFVGYLQSPDRWRHLDDQLFHHLDKILASKLRSITALEDRKLLPDCRLYCGAELPCPPNPKDRPLARRGWFEKQLTDIATQRCDVIFVDPDNGVWPPKCRDTHKRSMKYVNRAELCALRDDAYANDRTIVLYHHNSRRFGGHDQEIEWLYGLLRADGFARIQVLRSRSFQSRTFFILNASDQIIRSVRLFVQKWRDSGVSEWASTTGSEKTPHPEFTRTQ
jgi:hypothetical protein